LNGLAPEVQPPSDAPKSAPAPQAEPALFAIARIGQARQALADMLICYARLLQSNDDPNSRVQLRTELAGLLIDKDPELLDCVLDLAGKRRKASQPRVLELFDGLLSVAQRYEAANIPPDDPAWTSLRALCERLLSTYQKRADEIIPQLKIEGLAAKILPSWYIEIVQSLQGVTATEKLRGMLAQSPAFMLDGTGFSQAVDALDELIVAGLDADADKLTAHVCTALKAYSKDDRIRAVAGISLMIENSMDQSSRPVAQLEQALIDGCAQETSEAVLKPYLGYLLERTVNLFNRDYFDRAARHADTVALLEKSFRKATGEDTMNPVRDACSELSKTAWAKGLADHLISGGQKEQAAAKILAVIDRNLAATLIGCIGREDSLGRAQIYAKHLRILCPGSAKLFVALMSSQNDPHMLARMLAVAPHVGGDEEILEVLFPMLTHSHFELRAAALQFVLDRDNERTAAFVAARLRDPRYNQQHELWMSILIKLRHAGAGQVIANELQAEIEAPVQDDRRMMTLIEACAAHDDPRIGTLLLRLVRTGAGLNETRRLTAQQRENGKALKLSAMKALIRYSKDPRVYESFDRMRKDPDPEIARMAAYCQDATIEPQAKPDVRRTFASGSTRPPSPMATGISMRSTASGTQQKTRRGFEVLEKQPSLEQLFQPGAAINSGKHKKLPEERTSQPAPPPAGQIMFSGKQGVLNPAQLPDDLFAGMRPLLEGELGDLGLGLTARITCAKNGVMIIKSSLGNGALYIQNKSVVAAFFSGMVEIQALTAIGKLKQAKFAYYANSFSYAGSMNVEVSNIETAIREYLDMR
jgi:hypothetical protein